MGPRIKGLERQVVPARAGIFRISLGYQLPKTRRPRPRGDLPWISSIRQDVMSSSPPARGSSAGYSAAVGAAVVVPARAGIFPPRVWLVSVSGGRPRPRGDLPYGEDLAFRTQ